jgi:hypothetical protein
MLGLARLTGWNILYELGVNIALALGVFGVIVRQIRNTERQLAFAGLRWAIPLSSLIVFSISQYQNWLWGWQIQMLLNLLAVMGGILLLSDPNFRWRGLAAAAVLGVVGTYSFANGVIFWPIGLGILIFVTRGKKERWASITAWLLVSLLTVGSYLWHYQKPTDHPPLGVIFDMPLAYAAYVLEFLGGIGAQYYTGPLLGQQGDGGLALISGVLATTALAWAGGMVVWRKLAGLDVLLPYFAMVTYSIGTAMMTGIGRVGFGPDQALESRYCSMVVPLWVSLVVFLLVLMQSGNQSVDGNPVKRRPDDGLAYYRTVAAGSLLVGVIILLSLSSFWASGGAANMSGVQVDCRTVLLDLARHPGAEIDYGSLNSQGSYVKGLIKWYPSLVRYRLSLFRHVSYSLPVN